METEAIEESNKERDDTNKELLNLLDTSLNLAGEIYDTNRKMLIIGIIQLVVNVLLIAWVGILLFDK